jgi:tetratricopeptide (TPR) repeat protein
LPDGSSSIEPWLALLRALLCRDGVDQMRADAELAAGTIAAGSFWRTAASMYLGAAHLMAGDPDRADVLFEDAAAAGRAGGAAIGACLALAERSLLAIAGGGWEAAGRHLSQAWSLARDAKVEDYPPVTLLHAVAARIALHQGDRPRAIAELTRAQRLRPGLTYALPHLAVQARTELARCHLALADVAAARILLREVTEVLTRRPRPGRLRRAGRGPPGGAVPGPRFACPRGLGPDRRRAAPAADAPDPPVVPRDRRGDVPVPEHRQVRGDIHLPQAGRLLTQPGGHPVPRAGAAGGIRTGLQALRLRPFTPATGGMVARTAQRLGLDAAETIVRRGGRRHQLEGCD